MDTKIYSVSTNLTDGKDPLGALTALCDIFNRYHGKVAFLCGEISDQHRWILEEHLFPRFFNPDDGRDYSILTASCTKYAMNAIQRILDHNTILAIRWSMREEFFRDVADYYGYAVYCRDGLWSIKLKQGE